MGELGHELWVGDAARIRASEVRLQKTDARDAEHILDLLRTDRFPRIWVPSLEERDLRQLLVHRMKQVRVRTQVKNQLQALAISPDGRVAANGLQDSMVTFRNLIAQKSILYICSPVILNGRRQKIHLLHGNC